MVTPIGSAGAAQTSPAQVHRTRAEEAAALAAVQPGAATSADQAETGSAESLSALSSATARVGDQLQAQADAARVQRAAGETAPVPPDGAPPPDGPPPAEAESTTEESSATASSGAARGGPRVGGGAAAASETEATDYIAEADTNSDKTVSDQERIAYEKKLEQAKAQSSGAEETPQDQSRELQKAYGLAADNAPTVSAMA